MAMQKPNPIMPVLAPIAIQPTMDKTQPMATPPLSPTPLQPLGAKMNAVGGRANRGLIDGIIQGIFGTPTDSMTPAEGQKVENERAEKRDEAFALADSARRNPGAQFMNPSAGSGSLLDTIGKLFKLFGGGSGA